MTAAVWTHQGGSIFVPLRYFLHLLPLALLREVELAPTRWHYGLAPTLRLLADRRHEGIQRVQLVHHPAAAIRSVLEEVGVLRRLEQLLLRPVPDLRVGAEEDAGLVLFVR